MMRDLKKKIKTRQEMQQECARLREQDQCLAFTNGCFDILHIGHISYLTWARQQGDLLIVGLNSDASVKRNKSDKRPIVPETDRAQVLAALEMVDYIVLFDEDEPVDLIAALLPDVLVKGEDWAHYVSGREIVEQHGGRVALAPLVDNRSTTNLIERILDVYGKRA